MEMLITKTAGCGVLGDWAKQKGLWHPYTDTPKPGDVLLLDFTGKHKTRQHAAILESKSGNVWKTIEGNTSITSQDNGGKVMRRTRYTSLVVGFIRPRWTSEQTASELLAIAASQIGTKESPAGSNNVKYNTWYYGKPVYGAETYPWCAVFVSWCFAALAGLVDWEGKTLNIKVKELRKGSAGAQVKTLQRLLNSYIGAGLEVDGDFGAKTAAAVIAYKDVEWPGSEHNSIVGQGTWERLLGVS